jgi:hypothetical protein
MTAKGKNSRTIVIELNALSGLIAFNLIMLFVFIGLNFYSFNSIMQFLGNDSSQLITSSYYVIGYSVGIGSNIGASNGLFSAMGMSIINLPFIAVLILVIGNIVGLAKLRK